MSEKEGSIIDIEKVILSQVAQKVIESVPEDVRIKILEESLTRCLKEILKPWHVQEAIKNDVNRYMVEYLKRDDVQKRIKEATERNVSELMDGVIRIVISESQEAIKSSYKKFLKEEK